jgi:hypothetical protein
MVTNAEKWLTSGGEFRQPRRFLSAMGEQIGITSDALPCCPSDLLPSCEEFFLPAHKDPP